MTGSGLRGGPRRISLGALLLAFGLAGACATSSEPGITWDARTADAELERAQQAEAQGERERALELGRRALQHAREAAALGTVGRASLFVGRIELDLALCLEAVAVFEHNGDRGGEAEAQIATANAWLALGRYDEALDSLDHADAALAEAQLDRTRWARSSAQLHHTAARVLGQLGRRDEAQSRERQAELALSLLDDSADVALRIEVQLSLAADDEAHGRSALAIEHNSRVLYLAQRNGDRQAQIAALTGVVTALTELRRYADAVSHCERALDLARDLGNPSQVQALGRRGLELLVRLGDQADSARRQAFEQALLTGT
jgi:tetratricopeptide (TPR) repeat protein